MAQKIENTTDILQQIKIIRWPDYCLNENYAHKNSIQWKILTQLSLFLIIKYILPLFRTALHFSLFFIKKLWTIRIVSVA